MPYCPKCDMEFVEGIKVCSDCGGPLVESKEVAEAMKRRNRKNSLPPWRRRWIRFPMKGLIRSSPGIIHREVFPAAE